MDAATATIIVAGIVAGGSIVTTVITTRSNKTKYEEQQREMEAQAQQSYSDPVNHYFFGKMSYYMTSMIPAFKPSDGLSKIKLDMLKQFLLIKFEVFHAGMLKWVNDHSEIKLTETTNYICSLIREYETTAKAQGIPEIFIRSFALRHGAIVTATVESLEQIMRSTSYSENDKENAVLDVLLHSFSMTVLSAELTAKEMNGELEYALGCHVTQRPHRFD